MRVLFVHNAYRYRGGEDVAFEAEQTLLSEAGHEVDSFRVDNDTIGEGGLGSAVRAVWNFGIRSQLSDRIERFRPDLVHFHNTFPVVSPSAYSACRAHRVPVVQTIHNYRPICVNALLFRNGKVCTDCVGRSPWRGVLHRCYRGSFGASLATAFATSVHRALQTYQRSVDLFLAVSEFQRDLLVKGGLPAKKIIVKPNVLLDDPGPGKGEGGYAIYVGRLSKEKGVESLLEAWNGNPQLPKLKIVGTGPLADQVASWAKEGRGSFEGELAHAEALRLIQNAAFLVAPSLCHETFGTAAVEAFACGTPVLASELGAFLGLVQRRKTGAFFRTGNAEDLRRWGILLAAYPELRSMRPNCRQAFEARFTKEKVLEAQLAAYRMATD